jgi:F-type H+-transporting ATPase subunit delta
MSKNTGALARRYGTALYELLVSSSNSKDDFSKKVDEVQNLSSILTKNIIQNFQLASLTIEERIQILEFFLLKLNLDKISPEIISFLKLVLTNKRMPEIKSFFAFFLSKADEYLGVARATFISARNPSDSDIKDFEASLTTSLKKKVVLLTEVDESLKSGFIIKLGNMNIDASLKARLANLKELFN